jgi:AcrR family transcriptional regulator
MNGAKRSSAPAPRRGRPPTLAESQIVVAALKLASKTRLEDVSMRTLAKELGAPVMTLYSHVPSKEALQELVADHILRSVQVPPETEGPWEDRLRKLQTDAREAVARHRGVLMLPSHGLPEATRLAEGVLSILRSAGFDEEKAVLAFTALYTFMLGQIEVDSIATSMGGRVEPTLEGVTRSPAISRDDAFAYGLDAVIEGIKAMHVSRRSTVGSRKPTSSSRKGKTSVPKVSSRSPSA